MANDVFWCIVIVHGAALIVWERLI